MVERAQILHTDGRFVEASLTAGRAARKAGVGVVADADTFHEGLVDLARLSDYFIASEHFSASFLKKNSPAEACRRIVELGPRVAAVTLGGKGYVALAEGRLIERAACPVQAVDTTGCGDVFHAGFIYGLFQNWEVTQILRFANAVAALKCRSLGGRKGIPTLKEAEKLLSGMED